MLVEAARSLIQGLKQAGVRRLVVGVALVDELECPKHIRERITVANP
jgi:putative NADH-flavin reductase